MHCVFMLYGKDMWVERTIIDIKAQKYEIPYHSPDGKETKKMLTDTAFRLLPFGFYDIAFPKEYKDIVLTTLDAHLDNVKNYRIPAFALKQIRKILDIKDPGKFKTDKSFPWVKGIDLAHKNVCIIVLGIREDDEIADPLLNGWIHEAI